MLGLKIYCNVMLLCFSGAYLYSVIGYEVCRTVEHKYIHHKSIADKAIEVQKIFTKGMRSFIYFIYLFLFFMITCFHFARLRNMPPGIYFADPFVKMASNYRTQEMSL
jgi:hypothetical protein